VATQTVVLLLNLLDALIDRFNMIPKSSVSISSPAE
jgi:hypothetical protein